MIFVRRLISYMYIDSGSNMHHKTAAAVVIAHKPETAPKKNK